LRAVYLSGCNTIRNPPENALELGRPSKKDWQYKMDTLLLGCAKR
jgi:hypothetical protein